MKIDDNASKYLLRELPSLEYLSTGKLKTVRVGYLRVDPKHEVKVIEYVEKREFFVTIKTLVGNSGRESKKVCVSKEIFDVLYEGTVGQRVFKKRYEIKEGNFTLNFDEFLEDTKKGKIIMLEVDHDYQFPNINWANTRIDVSDDALYLNQNLAK